MLIPKCVCIDIIKVFDANGMVSLTPETGGPARIIIPNLPACKSIVQVVDFVLLPALVGVRYICCSVC